MWLMNVETRQLEKFFNNTPPYAILSHTWGKEEVSFQDLERDGHQKMLGYTKIEGCCHQAKQDGLPWVWVDTCCIDKTSSTELSEAINSMYRWYESAQVCYAYLEDVQADEDAFERNSTFRKSRWFERGWTLQELVAPSKLSFFNSRWKPIFPEVAPRPMRSRRPNPDISEDLQYILEGSRADLLSSLTNIPWRVLRKEVHLASLSVACRLS